MSQTLTELSDWADFSRVLAEVEATVSGCTVHIATPDLDAGRILAQAEVPVFIDDSESTLQARIKATEHQLYPAAIRDYLVTLE